MRKCTVVSIFLLFMCTLFCSKYPVWAMSEPYKTRVHAGGYPMYDYGKDKNWHYCHLQSEDGAEISIDSQISPFSWRYPEPYSARTTTNRDVTAQKIWFNLSNNKFTGNERVKVVFIKKYMDRAWRYYGYDWILQESVSQIQLHPVPGEQKFTGSLENVFLTPLIDFTYVYEPNWQEIAIEVDGKWLKDPISQTHNFKVDLLYPFRN